MAPPSFVLFMAGLTVAAMLAVKAGLISWAGGFILIVPVSWAALRYRERGVYIVAWGIASIAQLWLTAGDRPIFAIPLADTLLISFILLGFMEVLYRVARSRATAAAFLATSEHFHKAIIAHGSDIIWILGADGVIRYASPSALAMSDGGEHPLGRNLLEFVLPEDRTVALDRLAESLRRPGEVIGKFAIRVINGADQVVVLSVASQNLLADPAVQGIVTIGRNITEIVRAEDALVSREQSYRQLYLEAAEQARKLAALDHVRSAVADVDDIHQLASAAARAVSAALSQIPVAVALRQDDHFGACEVANGTEAWTASVVAAEGFAAGAMGRRSAVFRPDGYGDVAVPLRDGEKVVGVLAATGTPFVQITQTEVDLVAALAERLDLSLTRLSLHQAIAQERDFAAAIMETMNQPISVGLPEGAFQYTNPAYQRITGRSRDELKSMTIADVVPAEELPKVVARRGAAARGEESGGHETRILRSDGMIVPVMARYALQPHGVAPGTLVAVLTDLTETKRSEDALREANRTLEAARDEALAASRMKSEFLATLSHEIRTPMNGILGMAELLLDTPLLRTQREYGSVILQSGQAMMEIINSILDFSRLEAGRMQLVFGDVSVRAIVGQVTDLMRATARNNRIALSCVFETAIPEVIQADEGRLRQVLLNLIGNAVKFTDAGSVEVRVSRPRQNWVQFAVTDTGIGISPQLRDRLFTPFSQGDSSASRRHGGTGLGLAISKSLVELMGGEIGVDSDGISGATFWFSLPT